MLSAILVVVVGGLILAGILAGIRWLRVEKHRKQLRQRFCRHVWRPIDKGGRPGDGFVFITGYDEYCSKCGLQRTITE